MFRYRECPGMTRRTTSISNHSFIRSSMPNSADNANLTLGRVSQVWAFVNSLIEFNHSCFESNIAISTENGDAKDESTYSRTLTMARCDRYLLSAAVSLFTERKTRTAAEDCAAMKLAVRVFQRQSRFGWPILLALGRK